MKKIIFSLLLVTSSIYGSVKSDIFFKTKTGHLKEAVDLYLKVKEQTGKDDFEIIEKMAYLIIDQGFHSKDPKEQFLATFGAGVARSSRLMYILEDGLDHENPQIQLASLSFLAELHDDFADDMIKRAMSSNYLIIRYEAAKILAANRNVDATDRIEGLMNQLDPALEPLFPALFAISSDHFSTCHLKKCFNNKNNQVRLAAILSCIDFKRDDLLTQIRSIATCGNMEEQEAAAFALGALKDSSSTSILQNLCKSPYSNVRLAALTSLYKLGDETAKEKIILLAKGENLFAISFLSQISDSQDILFEILCKGSTQVKVNAALALLRLKDDRCLPILLELLVRDSRDIAIIENLSPGFVLPSWKAVSCASSRIDPASSEAEMFLAIKESLITEALELSKESYLMLAKGILNAKDPELVPAVISNLETLQTPETIEFLKKELIRAGAPLTRAYCNLALYKLKEEGPYEDFVIQWVKDLKNVDMINFRPLQPRLRGLTSYKMTPQETCRLFVDAITTLANEKKSSNLDALLIAMSQGHPANRFALAGLILRAIE